MQTNSSFKTKCVCLLAVVLLAGCQQVDVELETFRTDRGALDHARRFAFVQTPLPGQVEPQVNRAMERHADFPIDYASALQHTADDPVWRDLVFDAARRTLEAKGFVYDAQQPQVVLDVQSAAARFVYTVPERHEYVTHCYPYRDRHGHKRFRYVREYQYRPPYPVEAGATVVSIIATDPSGNTADRPALLWKGHASAAAEQDVGGTPTMLSRYLVAELLSQFPQRTNEPGRRQVPIDQIEKRVQLLEPQPIGGQARLAR